MLVLAACEQQSATEKQASEPQPNESPNVRMAPGVQNPAQAEAEPAEPPLRVPAAAAPLPARPPGTPTGTFVDRDPQAELRMVCYNVLWNNIFPEESEQNADRFVRVMRALNPDIVALQEIALPSWRRDEGGREWSAEDAAFIMNAALPLGEGLTWHGHQSYDNVILSRFPLEMKAKETKPRGDRGQAIALVDLPDAEFAFDFYVMNNHYKCCDPEQNDVRRQEQSDAIVNWLRDARTEGGEIDLPAGTAIVVCGDLNIVGSFQPVTTLVEGDIIDEEEYGVDSPADWDGTGLTDLHPRHNVDGADDYTWRDDTGEYDPGRLDYIIYSDSVLEAVKGFVLNTTTMSDADLAACGLEKLDVVVDDAGEKFDHLPLVVDFRAAE